MEQRSELGPWDRDDGIEMERGSPERDEKTESRHFPNPCSCVCVCVFKNIII